MRLIWARFKNDESAATLIEYGLLAAMVGVAAIVVLGELGNSISGIFSAINVPMAAATAP